MDSYNCGFYHDGRFASIIEVLDHYNAHLGLNLNDQEKVEVEQYLLSLGDGPPITGTSIVSQQDPDVSFTLLQNYPNPFQGNTTIDYRLDQVGTVSFEVYTVLGQRVTSFEKGVQPAGHHSR